MDNDVKDRSGCTAHQFDFGEWRHLVMHSPQGSLAFVKRNIALRDVKVQTARREFLAAERASEEAALVFMPFRFNHESTRQFSLPKNQVTPGFQLTALIGGRLEYTRDVR